MQAREGLLLLVVATAAFSVWLTAAASAETYRNFLFASNKPGGGFSTTGVVDHISEGIRSRMGHRIDTLHVRYSAGSGDRPRAFNEPVPADESYSRSVHPGDTIPLRVWGNGAELARVDVPSEKERFEAQARGDTLAALVALSACFFSTWGCFRYRKGSGS